MPKHKYKLSALAHELGITGSTLMELRRKLNINHVDDEEYIFLKCVVGVIRKRYGRVTLSSINDYLRYHSYE